MPVVLIATGALVLALALALARLGRAEGRRARLFVEVPTYDCAQVAEIALDAPGMRIEVTGTAEAPGAPLVSPVRGEPCVWWRREQVERRVETRAGEERETWRTLAGDASATPFLVRDASGAVPVDAAGADVDPGPTSGERYDPLPGDAVTVARGRHGDEVRVVGHLTREWLIRPGAPVYVIGGAVGGRAGGPAGIGPPREGAFVVSVRDEAALAGEAARRRTLVLGIAAALVPAAVAMLVIGLGLLSR